MTKKTFLLACLLGMFVPETRAHHGTSEFISVFLMEEGKKLPLLVKTNTQNNGEPNPRTLIPEVTMQENNLRFITPCNGCTFRLVQNDIICYSTEVTGNILTIPSSLTGTYELQIVSGDIIFYTEITL